MYSDEYNQNKKFKQGTVYVLDYGNGSSFKIGMTTGDVHARVKQISRGSVIMPMKLVMYCETLTNCALLEELIHMMLDGQHENGEWFKLDFVGLMEVYDALNPFGGVKVTDHWYSLVPDDYEAFLDMHPRSEGIPFFTKKAEIELKNYDWSSVAELIKK